MKKILALAIAVMMICVCAISVSAAQTTLPDSDGTAWWVNHTEGVEVTEEGVEITFTNTTYADATANWNGPLFVAYTGSEAKVGGADYVEYWVTRGDIWGWGNAAYYGVTGDLTPDVNNATAVANMAAVGITFTTNLDESWGSWDQYLTALKAGAEGKITAKLVDGKLEATMTIAGATSTVVLPVDTTKPVYISLFAELAKLTNIVVTTNEPAPEPTPDPEPNPNDPPVTGDIFGVVVALMAISGTALVSLKKKH